MIGLAIGTGSQIALATAGGGGNVLLLLLLTHRREATHVEASAERAAFAGNHNRAQALGAGKLRRGLDQRVEHCGIERIHLVGANQTHVGDAAGHRHLDAVFHCIVPLSATRFGLYRTALLGFSQSTN